MKKRVAVRNGVRLKRCHEGSLGFRLGSGRGERGSVVQKALDRPKNGKRRVKSGVFSVDNGCLFREGPPRASHDRTRQPVPPAILRKFISVGRGGSKALRVPWLMRKIGRVGVAA